MRLDSVTATPRFGLKRLSSGLFGSGKAGRLTVVRIRGGRWELWVSMIVSTHPLFQCGGGVVWPIPRMVDMLPESAPEASARELSRRRYLKSI